MNNKRLHPVMFAGTGSDVGKSIVAAAFCRIFLNLEFNSSQYCIFIQVLVDVCHDSHL